MKPQQPNIEYCIEHREFVNGLLEKRGGWQDGEWYRSRLGGSSPNLIAKVKDGKPYMVSTSGSCEGTFWSRPGWDGVWLPSEGDVLAMLEARGMIPELLSLRLGSIGGDITVWFATDGIVMVPAAKDCYDTPLIALLELLKATEEA